jgi:zinc transport system ATP-binding protein
MSELLLEAKSVSVKRQGRFLLQKADLQLYQGKITTLIGPNGAGKTTLVRSLLGLLKTDEGSIWRSANLRLGYMPQKLHLDASFPLTVERFLTLAGKPLTDMQEVLSLTAVDHLLKSPMQHLSGGETQRVLLARALLRKPQLLVLDEPVQGVDITGQAALYELIHQIRNQRGCGVLLVSHDLHLVMATTDTVVCLNQHICCQGHPEQVTNDPAYIALFGDQPERAAAMAIYTHHHDHQHDAHGKVIRITAKHSGHDCGDHCEHDHHA